MSEYWGLSRDDIGLRCWADGCIAYQPLSGDTHMLTLGAGRLLESLRAGPKSLAELAADSNGRSGEMDSPEDIEGALQRLSEARLIHRTSS